MRLPKLPLAFVGTLGAIGAWYAYKGDGPQHLLRQVEPQSQTRQLSSSSATASPPQPTDTRAPVTSEQGSHRIALVVWVEEYHD